MTPEQLRRVKELFLAASDRDLEHRSGWLDELPGEAPEVVEQVRLQLQALEDAPADLGTPEFALRERLPERIGPYRVEHRIGAGGMGVVYLCSQERPVRRSVAVKRIRAGMDSDALLRRFHFEQQVLADLEHPAIAQVYDAGVDDDGRPYFAMEHVEGTPLTGYCDHGRLDTDSRLRLFVQVCRGVQHAHHRGVVHRDLKPQNILVVEVDGVPRPKIIDFGIAKSIDRERVACVGPMTLHGEVLGTPEYMAPEQFSRHAVADTRSDQFSLGVLLYELLTGSLPVSSDRSRSRTLGTVQAAPAEDAPLRPSIVVSTRDGSAEAAERRRLDRRALTQRLRGDLDWVTMRAVERTPERRYGSVGELADDLERHLDHQPVLAGPPSTRYRVAKFVQRNRGTVVAGGGVLVALLGGLVAFAVENARARDFAALAARRERQAVDARDEFARQNRILRGRAYASRVLELAELARDGRLKSLGDRGNFHSSLDVLDSEFRGMEWDWLAALSSPPPVWRRPFDEPVIDADLSPDAGELLLVLETPEGAVPVRTGNGPDATLRPIPTRARFARFCPDGEGVLTAGHPAEGVTYWSEGPDGWTETRRCETPGPVTAMARIPGSDRLLIACGAEGQLRSLDPRDLLLVADHGSCGATAVCLAVDDRERVLAGRDDTVVQIRDLGDPASCREIDAREIVLPQNFHFGKAVECVAFTSDSKAAIAGLSGGDVGVWSLEDGRLMRVLEPHQTIWSTDWSVNSLVVDPAGRWVVTSGRDGLLRVQSLEGFGTLALRSGGKIYTSYGGSDLLLAADRLGQGASSTGLAGVLRLADLPIPMELVGHERGESSSDDAIAVTKDGKTAYTVAQDDSFRMWELRTGRQLAAWRDTALAPQALALHPSDNELLVVGRAGYGYLLDAETFDIERTVHMPPATLGRQAPGRAESGPLSVAYASDGRSFAVGFGTTSVLRDPEVATPIVVFDHATLAVLHVLEGCRGTVWEVAFHPTRNLLAAEYLTSSRIFDLDSDDPAPGVEVQGANKQACAFHPRTGILYGASQRELFRCDPLDGSVLSTVSESLVTDVLVIGFDTAGDRLLAVSPRHFSLLNADTGDVVWLQKAEGNRFDSGALLPGGGGVLVGGWSWLLYPMAGAGDAFEERATVYRAARFIRDDLDGGWDKAAALERLGARVDLADDVRDVVLEILGGMRVVEDPPGSGTTNSGR